MKPHKSGRLVKSFYAVLMLCSALLAGCVANRQDAGEFKHIANRLEDGGTVYGVFCASGSMPQLLDEYIKQFDSALAGSKIPSEDQDIIRKKIAAARMFWHLSGLNNCSGFGLSSVRDDANIYSNRVFIALDAKDAGEVEKIFVDGNDELVKVIAGLPAETFQAVGGKFTLRAAFEIVSRSGCLGNSLQKYMPPGFPLEIFSSMDGWWVAAVARNPVLPPQENCFMLQVPDKDGKIFNLAKMFLKFNRNFSASGDRIVLPFKGKLAGWQSPLMKRGKESILLYSDERAEKLFEKLPGGSLKDEKLFKCYSNGIKLDGEAFVFSRRMLNTGDMVFEVPVAGVPIALESRSCFGVLSRESDGWLWSEKSDIDLSGGVFEFLVMPGLGKYLLPRRIKKDKDNKAAKVSAKPVEKRSGIDFSEELKKLHGQLLEFANKNNGNFPEFTGADTLKKSIPQYRNPGKVFYFGGRKGEADLPLAIGIDAPEKNVFHVLYADGKIKKYNLERPGSCRRIISFLFTVHRWKPELFQRLIEQAQILDGQSAR